MLHSLISQLWNPMREQLSLIRALATGARVPGISLVLLPGTKCNSHFGIMEHLMMALAGAWLLMRVIYSDLAIEDNQQSKQRKVYEKSDISYQQTEQSEQSSNETCSPECQQLGTLELEGEEFEMDFEKEQLFYWGWHRLRGGHKPLLKFTLNQLETLLRLEQDTNDNDDDEYEDEDDDQYRDDVDNNEFSTNPSASGNDDLRAPGDAI